MQRLSKYEVSETGYQNIVANQILNQKELIEVTIGSRKKLYTTKNGEKSMLCTNKLDNKTVSIGNIKAKSFNTFLAEFKRGLHKAILKNPELIDYEVYFKGVSRKKNYQFFDNIKIGDYFYLIDFNSAYWQMAHKLGYISTKFYKNYILLNDYKKAKRLCFSFLARTIRATYSTNKEVITCDTTLYQRVYNNIRYLLYNYLIECVKLTNNEYIEYNIDGIIINADKVDIIKNYLKAKDILFKVTECRKLNNNEYMNDYNIVKFTNK